MKRRAALKLVTGVSLIGGAALYRPSVYEWRGFGFGGEISFQTRGRRVAGIEREVSRTVDEIENEFSLFRENSALSRLNRDKILQDPSEDFYNLMQLAAQIWRATGGRFDPSVQNIWRYGAGVAGFDKVEMNRREIRIHDPEISLTLNGIAQGFASDFIARKFEHYGVGDYLVNMGEYAAGRGDWLLEVQDAGGNALRRLRLKDGAIATSSPFAMERPQGGAHIIDPHGQSPRWDTVSVEAKNAAMADGLSTAFTLMEFAEIEALDLAAFGVRRVNLWAGDKNHSLNFKG